MTKRRRVTPPITRGTQESLGFDLTPAPMPARRLRCQSCGAIDQTRRTVSTVDPRWVVGLCDACHTRRATFDVLPSPSQPSTTEGATDVQAG